MERLHAQILVNTVRMVYTEGVFAYSEYRRPPYRPATLVCAIEFLKLIFFGILYRPKLRLADFLKSTPKATVELVRMWSFYCMFYYASGFMVACLVLSSSVILELFQRENKNLLYGIGLGLMFMLSTHHPLIWVLFVLYLSMDWLLLGQKMERFDSKYGCYQVNASIFKMLVIGIFLFLTQFHISLPILDLKRFHRPIINNTIVSGVSTIAQELLSVYLQVDLNEQMFADFSSLCVSSIIMPLVHPRFLADTVSELSGFAIFVTWLSNYAKDALWSSQVSRRLYRLLYLTIMGFLFSGVLFYCTSGASNKPVQFQTIPIKSSPEWKLLEDSVDYGLARFEFNYTHHAASMYHAYKKVWNTDLDQLTPQDKQHAQNVLQKLEKTRFLDWMANGTLKELYHSYSGKGIVVPVYNKGFYHAYLAIRGIREVHQSSLPIYCTYNGEDDLAPRFREKLLRVQNVTLIDLEKILPPEKIDFDGWSNKPAMLLAAPCEECVLMDSDVWWLQSPERAFEQSKYLETGMLLYKDRTVPVEEWDEIGSDWVKGLVPPEGLPKIADLRIMQHKSMHEVESGVVIVNKRKRFLGLLFVTYLNAKEITPESYDTFLGDKETFWIGMTTMLEDYHLDPHKVVTLGFYEPEQSPNELCSQQMAHLDEDGDLFWIHGGVVEDKFDFNSKMQKFTHWIEEVNRYHFVDATKICMILYNKTTDIFSEPRPLNNPKSIQIIHKTQEIWAEMMVELRNISFNYVYHGASFYRSRFHAFSWEAPDFTLNDLLQLSQSEEIPLILHQTWKDHLLPEKFKIMTGTWKVSNPKLKRILWTDQDNLLLLKLFHPEWLALYQELPKKIYQLYFMRYVYLLVFGGVYADLDTAAYRSVVPLLKGHNLVLGEVSNDREWPHNIPNAMMASKPDQAFWSFVISKIVALKPRDYARNTPELTAGPGLLHQSVKEWKAMSLPSHSLFILPPGYWFGVDWRSPTPPCDAVRKDIKYLHLCKESLGNFYVITIWSHSWS